MYAICISCALINHIFLATGTLTWSYVTLNRNDEHRFWHFVTDCASVRITSSYFHTYREPFIVKLEWMDGSYSGTNIPLDLTVPANFTVLYESNENAIMGYPTQGGFVLNWDCEFLPKK